MRLLFCAVALAQGVAGAALSQEHNAMTGRPASMIGANGFYVWAGGSHQVQNLPAFDLGYKHINGVTFADQGQAHTHQPTVTGAGVSGGAGIVRPDIPDLPGFGRIERMEITGAYARANGAESSASTYGTFVADQSVLRLLMLNGRVSVSNVGGCSACKSLSTLTSDLETWQLGGKAIAESNMGPLTITRSAALFAGHARNKQNLSQRLADEDQRFIYSASSAMTWGDVGAKLGLGVVARPVQHVVIDIAGTIGTSFRRASLDANDLFGGGNTNFTNLGTHVDRTRTTVPFLAGAEFGVAVMLPNGFGLRGFAGTNYDSSVPGLASPSYTTCNPVGGPDSLDFCGGGAGIKFTAERSHYFGGEAALRF